MKTIKINIYRQTLLIYKMTLAFVFGIFVASCTDDDTYRPDISDAIETDVRLTVNIPGSTVPGVETRSSADIEYAVSDIRILVFTREGNDYNFTYMVEGQQLRPDENNSQRTTFTARLKTADNPIKLLFAANVPHLFSSYSPAFGASEEEVREKLNITFDSDFSSGMPMYGEKVLPSLDAKEVNSIELTLLRSIARVDVEVSLNMEKSKDFRIESVYIYRANNLLQVMPDPDALTGSETARVKAPSVPGQTETRNAYNKMVAVPGDKQIQKVYLPEANPISDPATQYKEATCVVVGGYFDNQETPTFYRVDFNSGAEGHPFGQVLRNYRYQFKIVQVTGSGWETPDEAANNRSTTIVADIKTWEDFTMEMYVNGDNYFGIASRDVLFGYRAGLNKTVGIEATVPYKIYWKGSSESTTAGNAAVSNEYFSARIENLPQKGDDISQIIFTTLTENTGSQKFVSNLIVEWANWTFEVTVTQRYEAVDLDRAVRVLSVYMGTAGNLGTTDTPASAMAGILTNPENYSPRGTVNNFAGFNINSAKTQSVFKDADGTNNATHIMLTLLYGSDVVYLGNDNQLSAYSAQKVMEWHQQSPHRVLIVAGDAPPTSATLIREDKNGVLSKRVDWWYNLMHLESYKVSYLGAHATMKFVTPPAINDDNRIFMDGPFGEVTTTFEVNIADNIYGYAKTYSNDIIPLLSVREYPNYMTVGVDKKNRIIYHGDASLYQVGRISNANSKVITAHDKLWANIWAWIADQVILGDDNPIR